MAESIDIVKKTLIRKASSEVNVLDYGKLPPQAKELEEAVLGAVMIEQNAITEVADILKDETFYVDAHQRIWRAIRMLNQNSAPVDLLTVTEQLKKMVDVALVDLNRLLYSRGCQLVSSFHSYLLRLCRFSSIHQHSQHVFLDDRPVRHPRTAEALVAKHDQVRLV